MSINHRHDDDAPDDGWPSTDEIAEREADIRARRAEVNARLELREREHRNRQRRQLRARKRVNGRAS